MRLFVGAILFAGCLAAEPLTPACGRADDTASVQSALAATGASGGTVILDGCTISGSAIVFTRGKWLKLVVEKALTLTTSLVIPGGITLEGDSGGYIEQFQQRSSAVVSCKSSPCIIVRGESNALRNLAIHNPPGVAILIDGSAQITANTLIDNVGVTIFNSVPNGLPLKIDGAFWTLVRDSQLLAAAGSGNQRVKASIWMTNSGAGYANAGLLTIRDSVISGYGILVNTQVNANWEGNIDIHDTGYESGQNSFLSIDTTHAANPGGILLDNLTIADPASSFFILQQVGGTNQIRNVSLKNTPTMGPITNADIYGLIVDTTGPAGYYGGRSMGFPVRQLTSTGAGQLDTDWEGNGFATLGASTPFATINLPQSITGLTTQGAASVSPTTAPDGSNTGIAISSSRGIATVYSSARVTLNAGDWIIAGIWVQVPNVVTGGALLPTYGNAAVQAVDGGNAFAWVQGSYFRSALCSDSAQWVGNGWVQCVQAVKVATNPNHTTNFQLLASTDTTHPYAIWMPWAIRIPSGSMSDTQVTRYARYLRNQVSNLPAGGGISAFYPHQKLYWGNDTDLYRESPGVLRTDGVFQSSGLKLVNLPVSCVGQSKGTVWNNSGILGVCP